VLTITADVDHLISQVLELQSTALAEPGPEQVDVIRLETTALENLKRIHTYLKRIAREAVPQEVYALTKRPPWRALKTHAVSGLLLRKNVNTALVSWYIVERILLPAATKTQEKHLEPFTYLAPCHRVNPGAADPACL